MVVVVLGAAAVVETTTVVEVAMVLVDAVVAACPEEDVAQLVSVAASVARRMRLEFTVWLLGDVVLQWRSP
ncbi:MAG: hypothetical protein R2715_16745 [Ilumatobacteraceae bacterium]